MNFKQKKTKFAVGGFTSPVKKSSGWLTSFAPGG